MRDFRVIDRDELLDTVREHQDMLVHYAQAEALEGNPYKCRCMMYAHGEIDALRDELAAMTKHTPDAVRRDESL